MMRCAALLAVCLFLVTAICAWAQSPAPGPNVNMVSGTDWTTGDPFLQRQNEPSIAVSTRNPSHLVAGDNDYRSVDFEELFGEQISGEPTPDAWLGVFKSFDGGATWASTLLPGFPADTSAAGRSSPLFGLQAAADPIVRAGTNGMFYYAGIAFNRNSNVGRVFVTRFIDNNNKENGDPTNLQTPGLFTAVSPTDPIRYLGTSAIQSGSATQFLDKPWLAVDVPRGSATCKISYTNPDGTGGTQTIPASNVYVTFSDFVNNDTQSAILFTRSTNCGSSWSKPIALSSIGVNQGSVIAVAPPIPGTENLLPPIVYVAWRQFGSAKTPSAIMMAESLNGGASFTPAFAAHTFPLSCNTTPTGTGCPFDQGITGTSFRTNAYPALAADTTGRMYLAWSQRQANGDGRIMLQVGLVGIPLPPPVLVDSGAVFDDNGQPFTYLSGRGHQIMPSLTFNAGKLMMIYYDLRQDHTIGQFTPLSNLSGYSETRLFEGELSSSDNADPSVFNFYISDADPPLSVRRHTLDVQGAQATPLGPLNLSAPAFTSFRIAHYQFGINPYDTSNVAQQLEVNPPNLPMFQTGTVPFMGDYIDVAGAPPFVMSSGKWHFNTDTTAGLPVFHAAWTDNRNVRPPTNGNWAEYTPPYSASNPGGGASKFDPTKTVLTCNPDFVASRNQDIYTSRIAPGLVVLTPGNQKTLGFAPSSSTLLQRAFSVVVQNTTTLVQSFRLTIANQPLLASGKLDPMGQATFQQVPATPTVTTLDVQVNPLSSISRMVFVKSQNPTASVTVNVQQITGPGGTVVSGGLTGTTVINPDPTAPPIINPDNPSVGNPSIGNAEVYNPSVGNPSVGNPSVGNTELVNPSIGNPSVGNPSVGNPSVGNQAVTAALNPSVGNPSIGNPSVGNPSIGNPSVGNQSVTDASYTLTNTGNTTATYTVQLYGPNLPSSLLYQLILNKVYYLNEPGGANGCTLQVQPTNVILSNIPNPPIVTNPSNLGNPSIGNPSVGNATVAVPPGETVQITLRISPGNNQPPLTPDQVQNQVLNNVTPVVVSHAVNTQNLGTANQQPPISLTITTKTLPNAATSVAYSQQLAAIGGVINPPTTNYTWSVFSGNLPPTFSLSPSGLISGTTAVAGLYQFTVQVADAASPAHTAQQALSIQVIAPLAFTLPTPQTATVGQLFTEDLSTYTSGGMPPYTYNVTVGSVAPFVLTGSIISGTPSSSGTTGSFTVQVTDHAGSSTTSSETINIQPPVPTMLTVTPGNNSLTLGQTQQFTATATFSDGTTGDVTSLVSWSSSDTLRLPISTGGLASAYNEDDPLGTGAPVTITATLGALTGISLWHVTLLPSVGGVLQPYSCSLEHHLQSLSGSDGPTPPSTATSINFVNNSGQPRKIIWLDYSGNRVLYNTLSGGTSYVQGTYLTHPWVIAVDNGVNDTNGACLAIYVNPDLTQNTVNANYSGNITVQATDVVYAAGSQSSIAASRGGTVPGAITLPSQSGSVSFSSVQGSLTSGCISLEGCITFNSGGNLNDPDGTGAAAPTSTNTGYGSISGMTAPGAGYLVGVFVAAGGPSGAAPPALDFTSSGVGTSFTMLSPLLNQVFFIGDGLSSDGTGTVQTFNVPTGANQLYLGTSDSPFYSGPPGAYSDNLGSYSVAYTLSP